MCTDILKKEICYRALLCVENFAAMRTRDEIDDEIERTKSDSCTCLFSTFLSFSRAPTVVSETRARHKRPLVIKQRVHV